MQLVRGRSRVSFESEFYITECTWMRKHGWRTPQWKLIVALEPDFHFKPKVELYNLIEDPHENSNVADERPGRREHCCAARMEAWIAKREKETGIKTRCSPRATGTGTKGVGRVQDLASRPTTRCTSATRSRPPNCRRPKTKTK